MIIFSKDRNNIVNMDNVINIFQKECRVAVNYVNGSGSCIGEYESAALAKAALKDITDCVFTGQDVCIMDSDSQANAGAIRQGMDKTGIHHYANGQKTKGHGGS